jgi:hypothetical protein
MEWASLSPWIEAAALGGLRVFLLLVACVSVKHSKHLFGQRHGWTHRLVGGLQLLWILLGVTLCTVIPASSWCWIMYDCVLACLGTGATLTAAKEFPHRYVTNAPGQSGTLGQRAIVTQAEMIEHSFYQGLNLMQAIYLHGMACLGDTSHKIGRFVGLLIVTVPWWIRRSHFPVHSFSNNWKQTPRAQQTQMENILYRIKKCQYIFYKHCIYFGLNLSMAVRPFDLDSSWRIFWIALHTSYVMEFFLQTMVKRRMLTQGNMLRLQRLLMASSSLAAVATIIGKVQWSLCLASLVLNFWNRNADVANTMLIGGLAIMFMFPNY